MAGTREIQRFEIGGLGVVKVVDHREAMSPKALFVDRNRDSFDGHLDWLQPKFLDADKAMRMSFHSFLIQTKHHLVLVDTCIGNHKKGGGFPQWNDRQGNYLLELAAAGYSPEQVDYVFCTHMHVDHCGWNTQLKDGRWAPTFPNAKYLFNQQEWASWKDCDEAVDRAVIEQNILPIIEANQVQWVDNEWQIDDQVHLIPTPGHTQGHCSVGLKSQNQQAVITGDMMIHPVQIAEPDWQQRADYDPTLALNTRREFVDKYCDADVLILGTHFDSPTGVFIIDVKGQKRLGF